MDRSTQTTEALATILLVDADTAMLRAMGDVLAAQGYLPLRASSAADAMKLVDAGGVHVVITDAALPEVGGLELLEHVRAKHPEVVVIFTSDYGSVEQAVEAVRRGAYDYLTRPVIDDELRLIVGRAVQQQRVLAENQRLRAAAAGPFDRIIGGDHRMLKVFDLVEAVADSKTNVLITGESGTGKSLVARAIHDRSGRRDGPYVEVSCGALPETLLESELFGHVRGAFTDAVGDRAGKFASADGGTIFLDEIGTASPALQVKLLRVLQERTFEPVGSNRSRAVDVRVIAASNRDLAADVEAGSFRRDLYYRINVVQIALPRLARRVGDIRLLAEHFLARFRRETGRYVAAFSEDAFAALQTYDWPGNVRELENCIERAVVLCRSGRIGLEDLPAEVVEQRPARGEPRRTASPATADPSGILPLSEALLAPERRIISDALAACGGSRKATAAALGIDRTTLYKKMRKLGLLPGKKLT